MNYNNIPKEMKELKQWVCYKTYFDEKENKQKKIMISPNTESLAKVNTPNMWSDFNWAQYLCTRNKYNGLAFVLTEGITFIDLDHAIDKETGEIISEEAIKLLELLPDTFTEKSVSGTGIHILLKGRLPENCLKRNDSKGIEMYDTKRFICMTGELISEVVSLADYSDKIEQINYDFVGKRAEPTIRTVNLSGTTDTELLEAIEKSRQGTKFLNLYKGDISNYPSHSQADFALAAILAWWTQDRNQIDRIFRSSGLMREKWDRRTNNSTYGANLIDAALDLYVGQETYRSQGCQM